MKRKVFEITITSKHFALQLPKAIMLSFLAKKLNRVKVLARFNNNELTFYGAIQKRKNIYSMMFGKRHQKEFGVSTNDIF